MSAASCLLSEDQFLCSICLDVFTDPVTTPCGHNFCKNCITQHWDINIPYQCPMCKEVFYRRPELRINTFISEMAAQFSLAKKKASSRSDQRCAKPGELIHPVDNLEGRMCKKHDKPLELFCKTDQMCVCLLCTVLDHKSHDIVPLKEEYEGKKAELGKTDAEIQQMIQKRRVKIQEIKRSVELSREDAEREMADSVRVFTALMQSVERGQAELIDMIEEKQKTTEKQAEGFIKELQQEISEVHRSSYVGSVRRAVAQLEETLSKEMKKLCPDPELKKVQDFEVDVTLDPDTAHPALILSDDGKQVNHGDLWKNLPDNPERFSSCVSVLGKQSFSSGRFYYEVQVRGKTEWTLGVARESINRKGPITLNPKNGYWTIRLRNENEYKANAGPGVPLTLKSQPQMVGVFVDYEEGLVSFYDVDAAALIYSYSGFSFTEKFYPYFGPCFNDGCKNLAPLIICPVNQTD
uniref:Uncharacterized protein n=1 Tax=Myripristis murdjan TaxID=586833 RepID=A0A668AP58_9TELE